LLTSVMVFALSFLQSSASPESSLSGLLLRASPIAKGVLLLLLIFSIASWSIIFSKWNMIKRAERGTRAFLERFRSGKKLSDLYMNPESYKGSPVATVFVAGYEEIGNQISGGAREVRSIESIGRVLQAATLDEINRMEKSLSWLATTANASPFIGLFGTVVGIIIAFQGLSGATGSSIQAVAPGIAEALIATAAGIATAVPAAIFYNLFLNRIKNLTTTTDRFGLEFLNFVERHYVKVNV